MYESPNTKKGRTLDEALLNQSPHHQKWLQKIAHNLESKLKDEGLFSPETQKELNLWFEENQEKVLASLDQLFAELKKLKSIESPAHELAHILDNLNSATRIFEEYGDFSEEEKLEVVLSCLGHDLGVAAEKKIDKIDAKELLFLMPALISRRRMKEMGIPEKLQLRILYDIASGSAPKTGHRTADVVHQCDREYLAGSRTVARNFAYDVALGGRELTFPEKEDFRYRLPLPKSEDDRWNLVQMEFYMRNIYPPVSPKGVEFSNTIKKDSAVIEMLGTEGFPERYEQVFAPEMGLVDPRDIHWSKKSLPPEVFQEAQKEEREFLANLESSRYDPELLMESIKNLAAVDKIFLPPNFETVIEERLDKLDEQERKNLWTIIQYSLLKRHRERLDDLTRLKNNEQTGVVGVVAKWLIEELENREEVYKNSSGLGL